MSNVRATSLQGRRQAPAPVDVEVTQVVDAMLERDRTTSDLGCVERDNAQVIPQRRACDRLRE